MMRSYREVTFGFESNGDEIKIRSEINTEGNALIYLSLPAGNTRSAYEIVGITPREAEQIGYAFLDCAKDCEKNND